MAPAAPVGGNPPAGATIVPMATTEQADIPAYHVAEVRVDGDVQENSANLKVTIDVEISEDQGWYDVPLRLRQAIIVGKSASGPGKQCPASPDLQGDGLHWLFQGAGTHRLEFDVVVPVTTTPAGRHLQLSLPMMPTLFEARITLRFQQPNLIVRSFNREATIRTREAEGGAGTILEGSVPAGRLELSWQERNQTPQPDWAANSALTLERSAMSWKLTAAQTIRRTESGRCELLVKPPAGFTVEEAKGPHLGSIQPVSDRPEWVRLTFGDDAPERVEIQWTLRAPFPATGGILNLGGFEIDGVRVHSGRIRILPTPGYQLLPLEESLQFLERVDDDAAPEDKPAALVYAFSAPQWRLGLNAKQVEPLFACLPRYEIDVSGDKARLTAKFRVRQNAGDVRELRVDVSRLEAQGWLIPIPPTGTQISRPPGRPGVVQFTWPPESIGEKSAEIRFERRIQGQEFEIPVPLPAVSATWLEAPELIVLAADPIRLEVKSDLPWTPIAAGAANSTPGRQVVTSARLQREESNLSLTGSIEKPSVAASTVVAVQDVQPQQATIEQSIRIDSEYGRLDSVRLRIPEGLPIVAGAEAFAFRIRIDGRDIEGVESMGGLLRIPVSPAMIGRFTVSITYAMPRREPTESLSIPVIHTLEADYSEVILEAVRSQGISIAESDSIWKAVPTSPDRLRWIGGGDVAAAVVSAAPTIQQSLQQIVIPSAFVQTRLTSEGIQHTTAEYRVNPGPGSLVFRFPARVRNQRVLVDGQPSSALLNSGDLDGMQWGVPLPRPGVGTTMRLSIAYDLPMSGMSAFSRVSVALPEFVSNVSLENLVWNLELPETQVVLSSPLGMSPLYSWTRKGLFWVRKPSARYSEALKRIGFDQPVKAESDADLPQYPYRQIGISSRLNLWMIDRSLVVLFGAGVTLILGFLFWTLPRVRNAVTFLVLFFGACLAGVWVAEPMQVFFQPALIGVAMATVATVIDSRARRWRMRGPRHESSIRPIPRITPAPLGDVRSTLLRPAGSDHGVSG